LKGISKFTKASNWASTSTPKPTETGDTSKIPDSGTSSWNTLGIPENTPKLNFLSLNEKKNNPWTLLVMGKLISPPKTPDTRTPLSENKTPKGEDIEDLLNKSPNNINGEIFTLRFRPNREDNPFQSSSRNQVFILPTFSTWKATDNIYYYNFLKNKGPVKRKVTFGQTITIPPSNLLSEK